MSIKGTLETFNLCELLQMLAFNQKEGTLLLEGERGARTVYLDAGRLTFLERDPGLSDSIARMVRFHRLLDEEALTSARQRADESGRNLGHVLQESELLDAERVQGLHRDAVLEQLFECQLTAVAGFEFLEGRALYADGSEGHAVKPLIPVESLLLDLARMLDHWNAIAGIVPSTGEIYEGTGIAVDLADQGDVDDELAATILPLIDGRRSLEQIAASAHVTLYHVMQVAATLYEHGGIRAVPTDDLIRRAEDLLARGEAAATVSIFQRCIDRGDASPDVRLRLADALEASGDIAAAAVELDAYAALSDDHNAPAVFEALCRALRLRGGELATAARTCDYYLRRRPWLQDYTELAARALRDLISGATRSGRPADAAVRLEAFIECGDAPLDDRVLLAELYEAGGARREAADALFRRADDLLATDRTAPARQLLRRVLELDPGHADARRRKMELEGVRQRRGHRARIALILLALGGVASAAGVAWFGYRDTSSTELTDAQAAATTGFEGAEARARGLIEAFRGRAEAVEAEATHTPAFEAEARTMTVEVRAIMASTQTILDVYDGAIREAEAAGPVARHRETHERYQQIVRVVTNEAVELVNGLEGRARAALSDAHQHLTKGEFEHAGRRLRTAWTLAFSDAPTRADAERKLALVTAYVERFETLRDRLATLSAEGQNKAAFDTGLAGLLELLDSDLTRRLTLPIAVTSEPAGAEVWFGGTDTGLRTPCVFGYSPFAPDTTVRLRHAGRTPALERLPAFAQMRRDPESLAEYQPQVHAVLPPGPRWITHDPVDRFYALWAGSGLPLVAGERGHLVSAVTPLDGSLTSGVRIDTTRDPIRLAGKFADGSEWYIAGHRTLTVRPAGRQPWEQITVGRIEHAPILVKEQIVLVDEVGTLYAWQLGKGTASWRVELGGAPSQRPFVGTPGILMATTMGAAYRIDPITGAAEPLAPAARGPALALPLGDGAVVLGGGESGCRIIDQHGEVRSAGAARPETQRTPWVGAAGVAWIDSDGSVQWLGADASAPHRVTGLGAAVEAVAGNSQHLFGAGADGHMRAVSLTKPHETSWSAPLGGRVGAVPVVLEGGLYVLVEGRLVAFDA